MNRIQKFYFKTLKADRDASYIVPHNIPILEPDGDSFKVTGSCANIVLECLPDGEGIILYDGRHVPPNSTCTFTILLFYRLWIVSIGGFYIMGQSKKALRKPTSLVSYMDYQSKTIKFGKMLPKGRVR